MNYGLSLSHIHRVEEAIKYLREADNVAQKLFNDDRRCKAKVYYSLAETLDKHKSGCEEAVKYAKKARGLKRSLSWEINFDSKMRKIIAKEDGEPVE